MKAISLWQPWASAIACGAKRIETRSWNTNYRGPLLIHAGASTRYSIPSPMGSVDRWIDYKAGLCAAEAAGFEHRWAERIPYGAIIAVAELVAVGKIRWKPAPGEHQPIAEAPELAFNYTAQEIALGDYTPGRYAWLLRNVRALPEPIPYKGRQGLFEVPADVLPIMIRQEAMVELDAIRTAVLKESTERVA